MKAKNSIWKNKLAKTTLFMTVILVAALFLGTAASAGLTSSTTPTQNKNNDMPLLARSAPAGISYSQFSKTQQTYQPFTPSVPFGDIIFTQTYYTPDESWNFITSSVGLGYLVQEDFSALSDDIGDVHWYGLCMQWASGWYPVDPAGMTFEIVFYEGEYGGSPGAVVATFSDLEPTVVDTGLLYGGVYPMWYWEIVLDSSVALPSGGWMSIQSVASPNDGNFLWAAGPDGNFNMRQNGASTGANGAFDLTAPDFQYDHDISVSSIVKPASGNAAPITPIVKVKNGGLFTETNVDIQLLIGKEVITGTVEDFEATNGSYIHYAKNTDSWQYGVPTSGPMAAHSGSNLWATILNGPYPNGMWSGLKTQPFVVPSGALFKFWNWYEFESNYDGGNVKISTDGGSTFTLITPVGGYPGTMSSNPYMTGQAAYTGTGGNSWNQAEFDLSAYEGQTVIILWETASDSSVTYAGWYIDDVGFSIVSWANVYDQTMTIPSIDPEAIVELSFPEWTPADLGMVENININYNAEAYNLFIDENPANDYKAKAFNLHYGYFNDVKVNAINSPINGLAESQTPEVAIENVGQFDQSANVNMQIGKIVYGAQWTQEESTEWAQSASNVAGGTAPEAWLPYYMITGDYAYLMSCPIDTSALSTLSLSFRSMINNYAGGYNCYIKSRSSEADPWTDVSPWVNPISASIPAAQYTVDITGDISTTTQVMFEFDGYYFNLNYWYVDDFVCGAYSTDFSGNFPPVEISTVNEYDQTTTVDIAAGATMNVSLPLWTPADLPFAMAIDYRADVTVTLNGFTPIYNYGFEDWVPTVPPGPVVFPPAGWTTINANGDSVVWSQYATGAHTGSYCASISYHYPTDDDWLTTQPVMIPGGGGEFSFWWKCGSTYYAEHFKVYYSTSGNTVADFTGPNGHVIGDITYNTDILWHQFTYAMTSPEQVWFAVYIDSADALRLSVDDFAFPDGTTQGFDEGTPGVPGHWPGWTIINYGVADQWFGVTSGLYPTCSPPEGLTMAEYNSWNVASGNAADLLQTGTPVDFTSAYQMKFKMMHNTGYNAADVIYPLLSVDGVNWWYDGTGFYQYDGTNGWKVETMDYSLLINYLGGPGYYYIGFEAVSDYGYNMFIDDLSVSVFSAIPDGNPANNVMSKTFTLSYEHDVGVALITEPTGPVAKADAYLQYDNGVYSNAFGSTTGQIYGANRFTPDEVTAYIGWSLDTIMWKHYGAESFTGEVRVYDTGSSTAPGAMITSEPFTVTGAGWFNITLSSPVTITGNDIWLCVEGTHASGQYPLECSAPGISLKSAFFSADESTWYDLPGLGYDVAWETRGHVAEVAPPGGNWPPGTYPVEGIIQNLGVTYDESNFDVNTQIKSPNGTIFYDNTVTVTDVLAPGATTYVAFPDFTIVDHWTWEGKYTLTMKTMLAGDDHSGNDKKTLTFTIARPDVYPPITNYSIAGTYGQAGWYISNPVLTLTAYDPQGKNSSGVAHTYYKVDNGATVEYLAPIALVGDGTHIVTYWSVDVAGNEEVPQDSAPYKVDTTAPVWITYTFTAQNFLKNKWLCEADVTDATSGVVFVEFYVDDALVGNATTTPYTFLFEGKPTNNSQALAYDEAGNSALSPIAQYVEMGYQAQSYNTIVIQQKLLL